MMRPVVAVLRAKGTRAAGAARAAELGYLSLEPANLLVMVAMVCVEIGPATTFTFTVQGPVT